MNRTEQIGYLTRNVELRKSKNGEDIAKFTIAINRRKTKEGADTGTDYLDVVVFGPKAMNCYTYLEKGMRVGVSGRLRSGSYVSRKSGQKIKTVDIAADDVDFLGYKKSEQEQGEPQGSNIEEAILPQDAEDFVEYDEDLPFDKAAEEERE